LHESRPCTATHLERCLCGIVFNRSAVQIVSKHARTLYNFCE
jgi:hypothetical protein